MFVLSSLGSQTGSQADREVGASCSSTAVGGAQSPASLSVSVCDPGSAPNADYLRVQVPGRRCLHCTQICHLCTCLNWLPMTCAAGRVFKGDAGGGAHLPGGLRRGGLAWRRGLPGSLASWAKRQGGPPAYAGLMALDCDVGWAAGFVSAGDVWVLPSWRGGDNEGLSHPGEVFDGLAAGVAERCRWPRRRRRIRTADERRRRRAAGWTSGASVRAADPAATVGQAWPGLLVSRLGSSGTGGRPASASVPWPGQV